MGGYTWDPFLRWRMQGEVDRLYMVEMYVKEISTISSGKLDLFRLNTCKI